MTKRESVVSISNLINAPEIVEVAESIGIDLAEIQTYCDQEIVRLDKKAHATSKAKVEKAEKDAELSEKVLKIIGNGSLRAGDIFRAGLDDFSSVSKVTSLLKVLVNDGQVERTEEKGVAKYKVVTDSE